MNKLVKTCVVIVFSLSTNAFCAVWYVNKDNTSGIEFSGVFAGAETERNKNDWEGHVAGIDVGNALAQGLREAHGEFKWTG